jgi:hypothetical protein
MRSHLRTVAKEIILQITRVLKSATKNLVAKVVSAIAAVQNRLSTASSFWIIRAREGRTILGIQLLVAGALVFIVMESWRTFGFWRFGGFPLDRTSPKVPIAVVAITIPLFVAISNRIVRSIVLILFAAVTTLLIQYGFSTPGIIATVWYPIIGVALAIAYFFRRFEILQDQIGDLRTYQGDPQYARLSLELLTDRCKFYLERWVVSLLALAAATGVMMTILWGDPFGAFIGTRAQKLTDAVYMVIGFFAFALITGIGLAYPTISTYRQCADVALCLGSADHGGAAVE